MTTAEAGKASITAPSVSVSYDAKALDALAASDDGIARLLQPHRKMTERAGTMRIVATPLTHAPAAAQAQPTQAPGALPGYPGGGG